MGTPKNTISSSKRRKGTDAGQRRFSTRSKKKNDDSALPSPAASKPRARQFPIRIIALFAVLAVSLVVFASLRRRSKRRQALINDLEADRLTMADSDTKSDATKSIIDSLKRKPSTYGDEDSDGKSSSRADGPASADEKEGAEDADSQRAQTAAGAAPSKPEVRAPDRAKVQDEPVDPNASGPAPVLSETEETTAINDFPSTIEWFERDDMKGGQRPLCRIAKPCLLSNGVLALPKWMQKSDSLIHKCGLGTHVFYDSLAELPGVRHVQMLGVDFALTIHPERFQEPTHALPVFLNEHLLKSSFLFDTFASHTLVPEAVRVTHCVASEKGANDCAAPPPTEPRYRAGLFVPRRMKATIRPQAFALGLLDMFGRAHSASGRVVHLNLSTMLVKSHRDQSEGLSATCFRSVLAADAMFRHLPHRALAQSSLLSEKNGVNRHPRTHKSGACGLTIGIFDVGEGPRGIVDVPALRAAIAQIARLALPSATVRVEVLSVNPEITLTDHVRAVQNLDVLVAGSGDELSGLAFLRDRSLVFEILQFGMVPDTYRSLANILGVNYYSLQSRPASDTFKNCLEAQIVNLRKKGTLGSSEYPPWWGPLMKTWDTAAAEFLLSGKTDFDILTNHTAIANFDSRHCAKMQSLAFNSDEAARSIVLQAKSLCDAE